MRPTVLPYFSKPCWSLGGFFLQSFVLTPYLYPFSDFTLEEAVGAEEPAHWEALPEGNLDSEVPQVKELS